MQLYLPLVEKFAHRYERVGAEHDDLVQAGSVGLLNAIQRYDRRRGDEFAAFAVPTIVGEMKRHVRDRSTTLRLPRPLQEAGARLPQARAELTSRLGRTPTDGELAAELSIDSDDLAHLDKAVRVQALAEEPDSLALAPDDGARELDLSEKRLQLATAFRALDPAEQSVLYLRFVRDQSRRQAAEELGISEGQLARRSQAALGKLRAEIGLVTPGQAAPAGDLAEDRERAEDTEGESSSPPPPERKENARPKGGRSGRLVLRMPPSLHAKLAKAAEREGQSLNTLITNALAAAVSGGQGERSRDSRASAPAAGRRWLRAAFITNVVVAVAAGVLAVILLLAAWDQGW